jgi:hypothetical protein
VPVLVVAAAVLGTWYLLRLWKGSKAPEAAKRVGDILRVVWKALLAVAALGVVAAMVQGCDGNEPSSSGSGGSGGAGGSDGGPPCTAYHEDDCVPGLASTTTTDSFVDTLGESRYQPCPAFHEEDCPLAVGSP